MAGAGHFRAGKWPGDRSMVPAAVRRFPDGGCEGAEGGPIRRGVRRGLQQVCRRRQQRRRGDHARRGSHRRDAVAHRARRGRLGGARILLSPVGVASLARVRGARGGRVGDWSRQKSELGSREERQAGGDSLALRGRERHRGGRASGVGAARREDGGSCGGHVERRVNETGIHARRRGLSVGAKWVGRGAVRAEAGRRHRDGGDRD
mmetsp:Transcript_2585/g.11551  ORF Transcript_2585/g.11551 Transcript_2585/m.11551 type:complete len:206 (+) Transcript_2585:440-1057(+)